MATTFADHLRSLTDEALSALVQLRPDLVVPVPADVSALAVRAQSRGSVARCLDGLDEFTLAVLDAARLSRSAETALTSIDAILELACDVEPADVRVAVERLRVRFLMFGADDALHLVAAIDEVTSPYPAGLGRPADFLDPQAAALCADKAKLRRTVLAAPPGARAVLDRLAAGPPIGALGRDSQPSAPPVRWLVDNHVLVPISEAGRAPRPDGELVELPREVGLLLRRDTGPLGPLRPFPPIPEGTARDPKSVDSAGAGQVMEAVRSAESLLEALAAEPAPVLRAGGLGVRDLKRLAKAAGLDEPNAALLLEVTHAAGLLGEADAAGTSRSVTVSRASGAVDEIFLPTGAYDLWRALSSAQRWVSLARAWLAMTRQPSLVGQRDDRDRPINALAPDAERAGAPQARREGLLVLADLKPGTAPQVDEVLGLLAWQTPRRARGREAAHRDALAGAAALGVTALGAITSYGRLLFEDVDDADGDPLGVHPGATEPPGDVVRTLDALLPAPVDHVLVQADLSVVVPGPPEPELAAELDVVAEPESAGGASVFRVTAASVRRALDVGYTAADLHSLFRRRSRTPVPQTLSYMIDDAARKHGGLRAGSAGSYLRSDDEALLAEVMADKRLGSLGLRQIAPTVLVSPLQVARLLGGLREAGFAPVAEDAGGVAVLTRPKVRRAPTRTSVAARLTEQAGPPVLAGPRLAGVVEQIRRGDIATRAARRAPVSVRAANGQGVPGLTSVQQHGQAMAVLQQAVREKARVWVGYVDSHGATLSRLVRPVSLSAGYLRAEDERTETLHTFALHRITAAVPDEEN
ncbi:helicase-associated domain-containing protein [Actinoplanes sp. Pm04-4]|uniref:Helicase-associated domain-containing protein n=1 Tax=Paractinoplanes pyxinae TaxID=2997416 RepID=A0ABT4AT94_9ACTN|nr:helicase-associated domain-containing protein [Actinoplanes pyxinae]MCY1137449.1 helicase-associated domain-containing protein [Actinoplanes pyxinae]